MTLPEKLAREALPCIAPMKCGMIGSDYVYECPHCERRPAVEAAIRIAIRTCEDIADVDGDAACHSCEQIRADIEMLLTQEAP